MRYNHGMKPTDSELRRQRARASDKDTHAIIARDFSASRMNATKWREAIDDLGDMGLRYRLRWVDVPAISVWMGLWIPFSDSEYFDSAEVGPFSTFSIEWLEVDIYHQCGAYGSIVKQDSSTEIERRLQAIQVPYEWVDGYIRIVGYVRNG